jgi:hypothetical protein
MAATVQFPPQLFRNAGPLLVTLEMGREHRLAALELRPGNFLNGGHKFPKHLQDLAVGQQLDVAHQLWVNARLHQLPLGLRHRRLGGVNNRRARRLHLIRQIAR